jgi:hypothetical protein
MFPEYHDPAGLALNKINQNAVNQSRIKKEGVIMDLSERGKLSSLMLEASSSRQTMNEAILLGTQEGRIYVHDDTSSLNTRLTPDGKITSYSPQEFFVKYGDPSKMVTLAEYRREVAGISGLRDERMHHAADLYNKAVDYGYARDKVEYTGDRNYGRIERELNRKLNENGNVPDVVKDQINILRGESSDLRNRETFMNTRLADVDADMRAAGLVFQGAQAATPGLDVFTPR